jgi:hypothetical protein
MSTYEDTFGKIQSKPVVGKAQQIYYKNYIAKYDVNNVMRDELYAQKT